MKPREKAPNLKINLVNGTQWSLEEQNPENFTLVLFYRGKHCPVCKMQLKDLERKMEDFSSRGVNVIAISVNTEEVAKETHENWDLKNVPLGYGLSVEEGREWGLFISNAISEKEPDQFVEPGIFLLDKEGKVYWESIQSMPFGRPDFKDVLNGIDYILKEGYPARGEA